MSKEIAKDIECKDECCCSHDHHHHDHEHHHGIEGCCCCGHDHGHHDKELTVKQIIFAVVMFVIGGVIEHLPLGTWLPGVNATILMAIPLVFFFVAYMICGKDVLIGAISNVAHGRLMDEVFLMSIASVGAAVLGLFEEATAIMIFYQVGEKFEDYAVEKSRNSIEEISKLRPDHATVKDAAGKMKEVSPDDVNPNSIIVVKPGDRIPIDGIVTDGESFVDTSALTGEAVPRKVSVGDEVLSGSINKLGVLEIRTTKHAGESALARILELVENATENKTKSEQFVTRFAKVYTPIVVYAALAVAIIPSIILGIQSGNWTWADTWSTWVYRALMFLVVSCPCAIVISVPLSFCGGITANTRNGVLIK